MSDEYAGRTVLVTGAGISGVAAAEVLLRVGAEVIVTDRTASARTDALVALGASFVPAPAEIPAGVQLVVTSPGWRPEHPLLRAAADAGIEVIGEVELAWRLREVFGHPPAPWLAVTGTNGKTTTVEMLASMLRAAGMRAVAAGNVGLPIVRAVSEPEPYDVLAVELSSFQLHWSSTLRPAAAAILNIAADHLDWHGSMAEYVSAKSKILGQPMTFFVHNADDGWSTELAGDFPDAGFTLSAPADGQLGVRDGRLVDRAFGHGEFGDIAEIGVAGPHNIANALAAAALAFAHGVPPDAVRTALQEFRSSRHRTEVVGTLAGVTYVNDSKATNPHAAAASMAAYERIVWVAGGLLKGADVDELVADVAYRLAGVVLMGADRAVIARALARHAPDVPVVEVDRTDHGAMTDVVAAAARLAHAGDVVLLAPSAASMDMFTDYAARGNAFVAAARALGVS